MAVVGYSLCSSTLLLANKMAMVHLPSPAAISFIQIVFSTVTVILLKYSKLPTMSEIDWFETDKVKGYALYVVIFVTAIYTNMKALSVSNVETVIVFRACSPIAVSVIEYIWMVKSLFPYTVEPLHHHSVFPTLNLGPRITVVPFSLESISCRYWSDTLLR